MANGVVGDPEAIRAFAQLLNQFCDELRERLGAVRSHLHEMGSSSWSDSKYQEYLQIFEQAAAQLHGAIGQIQPEHIVHLHHKAQELEDYLNS